MKFNASAVSTELLEGMVFWIEEEEEEVTVEKQEVRAIKATAGTRIL